MDNHEKIIQELKLALEENEDEGNAEIMSAYMKNHFSFYGIKKSLREEIFKPFLKELNKENYREIILAFWEEENRELHYCGLTYLTKTIKYWDDDSLGLFECLVTHHSWWDSVDWLATRIVGEYLKIYPEQIKLMDDWNADEDIWKNRVSIIFQLKYKSDLDFDLLEKYIYRHIHSKEFFLQKAIGWVLREYSKTNESAVRNFIKNNPELSSLSKREALKWLNKK